MVTKFESAYLDRVCRFIIKNEGKKINVASIPSDDNCAKFIEYVKWYQICWRPEIDLPHVSFTPDYKVIIIHDKKTKGLPR